MKNPNTFFRLHTDRTSEDRLWDKNVYLHIRHFHITHNAPYLPTKILHNLCFSFLLGITAVQEKLKTMLVQNFGGQIRCIMGNVEVACATN